MPEPAAEPTGIVRRIFGNLGFLLGGRAVAGLLSLVYMVIAARTLGPSGYGVLILVHSYIMVVGSLVSFPGWHAVVRYGALPMRVGDEGAVVRLLRFTAAVELIAGATAVILAALFAPVIGPILGWSEEAQRFAIPYSLAVLATVRTTPAGFLQLSRRFDLLALHSGVAPVVRLAGATIAAISGFGLKGFLIVWLAAALAEWAAMWIIGWGVARRKFPHAELLGPVGNLAREMPGIWRFMFAANADVTFGDLASRMVPLAIGWILGPSAAGLFSIAQRATVVLAQPAQILGQAAYSEFAKLIAAGDHSRALRKAIMRCVSLALASAAPVMVVLAFFSRDIAVMLGGAAFAGAAPLMIWLGAARTMLLIGPPSSAALIALGRPGLSVSANVGSSLITLLLLPALMTTFGLVGAGVQALLQAALTCTLLSWFIWSGRYAGISDALSSDRVAELVAMEVAETEDLS